MSQDNLLQGYSSGDSQYDDSQFSRSGIQDEVISVYEVYVKDEETSGSDGRSEPTSGASISGASTSSNFENDQIIQGDCMDLDAAIDAGIISGDATVAKLLSKDSMKYKILEQSTNDESIVDYASQTISEQQAGNPQTGGPRLVDKDDPRSRLHFVKYLKRDGKTLKIWECGICSKEFRHQYTLMRHLPTHTDERNFKCEACGKAFRQLSTLSQHKAIHSDARPYVCEFCKKTFNRVSTLISHRKTHSEQKPHKCHLCGKGFHQKGNLRNHVFTHTNERPYKCETCGKGFNQMSNLVCHKVKSHAHTEKMQYTCGICGMEFPRRFALRSHEEYKHGIKYRNPSGIHGEQQNTAKQNSTSTSVTSAGIVAGGTGGGGLVEGREGDTNTSSSCNGGTATPSSVPTNITGPTVMRNKNVRIVEMPNERNTPDNLTEYTDSIVIDKIDTKALETAIEEGQTPFALLKPVKGISVLVRVSPAGPTKHLLTPATAEDLRNVGKMTLSPTLTASHDGMKALQIKVPVVATITQNLDEEGRQSFTVEAPGPDQDQESLVAPLDSHFSFQDTDSSIRLHSATTGLFDRLNDSEITTAATSTNSDDCSELLELAAQGGIQFVRATDDGRYEVMTNSEARDLMAQNSHEVTILDEDDPDALDIVSTRSGPLNLQEDLMIDDPESQIMVLDSNGQKSFDSIEILDDKDIRILDPKNLDGMAFLSQMKIDDLILVPGKSSTIGDCSIPISSPDRDFTNLLNQRCEMNSLINKTQQQQQQQQQATSSMSILNDTMNYLRNCPTRSLSDDFKFLEDDGKIKFDNYETDAGLRVPDDYRANYTRNYWDNARNLPSFGEVKILGPKNSQETDNCLTDIRILGSYEQFLKGSINNVDLTTTFEQLSRSKFESPQRISIGAGPLRKEVKILGKKLESGFLESNGENTLVKIENDNEACRKMVSDVWEGWIERTYPTNDNNRNDEDNDDKENDITYADMLNAQI